MANRKKLLWRIAAVAVIVVLFISLEGCYYFQAISGQVNILRKRRPATELIEDPATDENLRRRLSMVLDARQFAVDDLLLPENDSYRSYADLGRDYVVWNVFAAPEFSLNPITWCYPVAGCVAYRGFFSEDKAQRLAEKLKQDGLDVIVGGVAAYSTLGRFDDPVLNTMMRWSDLYLVETLFHELAHQKLYIKGDSAFNEAFSTAVAEFGIERWLERSGEPAQLQRHRASNDLQLAVRSEVTTVWNLLDALYGSGIADNEMRLRKNELLLQLSDVTQALIDDSGLNVENWLAAPLNNAKLVSIGVYDGNVPAFRMILRDCEGNLQCFYARATEFSDMNAPDRNDALKKLNDRYADPDLTNPPPALQAH